MDNFKIIYKILKHLESSMDFESVDINPISHTRLNISRIRWEEILIMLYKSGYITGIVADQTYSDYSPRIVEPITPRITLNGLEYLQENSMMKKAYKAIKGIKDIAPLI